MEWLPPIFFLLSLVSWYGSPVTATTQDAALVERTTYVYAPGTLLAYVAPTCNATCGTNQTYTQYVLQANVCNTTASAFHSFRSWTQAETPNGVICSTSVYLDSHCSIENVPNVSVTPFAASNCSEVNSNSTGAYSAKLICTGQPNSTFPRFNFYAYNLTCCPDGQPAGANSLQYHHGVYPVNYCADIGFDFTSYSSDLLLPQPSGYTCSLLIAADPQCAGIVGTYVLQYGNAHCATSLGRRYVKMQCSPDPVTPRSLPEKLEALPASQVPSVVGTEKRQNAILSAEIKTCASLSCQGTWTQSFNTLPGSVSDGGCNGLAPPFLSFSSCVFNWPMDGRYCTTAVYADSSCSKLITEIDPTNDEPCNRCFNTVPNTTTSNAADRHLLAGAQSLLFYCYTMAFPTITVTLVPYKSDNCRNGHRDNPLPNFTLSSGPCTVLHDSNELNVALSSFKAKLDQPITGYDVPTFCKIQIYSDPFCASLVGVIDPLTSSYDECKSTFMMDTYGFATTGNSALVRCYSVDNAGVY